MLARRGEESIIEANEGHSVCHFCPNNGNLSSSKSEQAIVAPLRQFHEKDNHPQNNSVVSFDTSIMSKSKQLSFYCN